MSIYDDDYTNNSVLHCLAIIIAEVALHQFIYNFFTLFVHWCLQGVDIDSQEEEESQKLCLKKTGRPLKLDDELDKQVREYIQNLRAKGLVISGFGICKERDISSKIK